jgi:hypothetical protein
MTRLLGISFMASALALGACGGGDDNPADDTGDDVGDDVGDDTGDDAPDANENPACTAVTAVTPQTYIQGGNGDAILFRAPIDVDLGGGGDNLLQLEFYHLNVKAGGLIGEHSLSEPPEDNYATCDNCVRIFSLTAEGEIDRQFFQRSGSLTLDQDPVDDSVLAGLTGEIELEEVTIDGEFNSTPVPGGECLTLSAMTLSGSAIPAEYTCDDATYEDGATCNCVCGVIEPDCADLALPIDGCVGTQVCSLESTCLDVTAATNDTCATFIDLTVGTAVTGNSYDMTSNYNAGLETAECTGFMQTGPDVAYRVNLTAGQTINVTLTPTTPWDPAVAILNQGGPAACDAATLSCGAGADEGLLGDAETFTFTATTAGNHMILVESYSATNYGAFELIVENAP